jgi:hypothetical protein
MALIEKLTNIADAIREKTNNTEEMSLEQMADAIHNIETSSDGLDFSGIYDDNLGTEINDFFKDGIEYAKEIVKTNLTTPKSFQNDLNLVFMPDIDWILDGSAEWNYIFNGCHNLMYFGKNAKIKLASNNVAFKYPFQNCTFLRNTPLIDMNFGFFCDNPFLYCYSFETIRVKNVVEGLSLS